MPKCESKSAPLRMQGNNFLDNPSNLLLYVMERNNRSSLGRKRAKVTCLVDQQGQGFVGISLLESFETDSGKISDEVRELLREILVCISNSSTTMEIYGLLGHVASQ